VTRCENEEREENRSADHRSTIARLP
jgi:hypothetical protein